MVKVSTSIRLSVLIATLMALASCPGRDEDCPTGATEETNVTQGPVGRIDFSLDHPRKIKIAWFPSAKRDRLRKLAQEFEPLGNITVSANTRDGLFIGIDDGEWGGKLVYVPKETELPNQQIISKNVKFAFEKGDRLFVLTGLSHMAMSEGALWSVTPSNVPTIQKLIEFPSEVKTIIATPQRSLVFITEHGKYRLPWRGQIAPCQ
ncbi:hypothetical protein [Novosphingobium sp.]|uniref:hypothetical protein n=1 Tax=Novosphingobium sp. TaxID=1874826 RepID=UPI003BA852AD